MRRRLLSHLWVAEEGGVEAGPGGGGVEVGQHEEERGVEEGEARHGG